MPFDGTLTETNTNKLILQRARDRIARGWCQNTIQRGDSFCIIGAVDYELAAANMPLDDWGRISKPLVDLAGYGLASWNDTPGRTKAQVLALFDEAIAKLETNNG